MKTQYYKVRGNSYTEAHEKARETYGPETVVLRAAEVKEGGLFGFLGRKQIELTISAPATGNQGDSNLPNQSKRRPSAVERRYGAKASGHSIAGSDSRFSETVNHFQQLVESRQKGNLLRTGSHGPEDIVDFSLKAQPALLTKKQSNPTYAESAGVKQTQHDRPEQKVRLNALGEPMDGVQTRHAVQANADIMHQTHQNRSEAVEPAYDMPHPNSTDPDTGDMLSFIPGADRTNTSLRDELREMRATLEVLAAENPGVGMPAEALPYYRNLVDRGMTKKHAARLIHMVLRSGNAASLADRNIFTARLIETITDRLAVTGGIQCEPGQRRIIAIMGPTGVGKTTTLAKLAAHLAVHEKRSIALISADTYRIAAVEQLRVYAEIIGVPLRVVDDKRDMLAAVRAFKNVDVVLIDTAGRSQFNVRHLQELRSMLAAAKPNETYLALSLSAHLDDLRLVIENFRCLNPTALLFTKLDETRRLAAMYSLMEESSLPVSYLCMGQEVPDDIRTAESGLLADLVVEGRNRRGTSSQ